MKKLAILTAFLFIGCGSLKKHKEDTEIKSESTSNTTTELNYGLESYSIEPVNLDKPILIGSKEYHNTKIVYTKESGTEVKNEAKNEVVEVKQEVKEKESDNTKIFIYAIFGVLGLILIMFIILLLYIGRILKKFTLPLV